MRGLPSNHQGPGESWARTIPRTGSALSPLLTALHQNAEEGRVLWGQGWEWDGSPGAGNDPHPQGQEPTERLQVGTCPTGFLGCVAISFSA